MSQSATVNVGGEPCRLVTIDELCIAYGKQSKPDWLSEDVPATKKQKADVQPTTGGDILPEQADTTANEKTDIHTARVDPVTATTEVTPAKVVCSCTLCAGWRLCKSL